MRRNKHLLLWSSLGSLLLLISAAWEENIEREWRVLQRSYKSALPADEQASFSLQLRQVVVPALGVTDRCISCHIGMAPGESGIAHDPVFGPHPRVAHDPNEYGCTVCHGGQGRATLKEDAHGQVEHWPEPMIPRRYAYAGCGSCHTHLAVPNRSQLEHGRDLFERSDCLHCHAVDGRGGTLRPGQEVALGPDLSTASRLDRASWYENHLSRHEEASAGPWHDSFAPLGNDERAALDVYLDSRVGAPGLVEAKSLFHSLGCRGCHKVSGVGGDDGPDLTRAGQRDPGQLDFTHVAKGGGSPERDLSRWLEEHFKSPARIVAGSNMPALGLDDEAIDGLVFYMHSLRRSELPEAYWPRDRIEAERFGEREFRTDGTTLYGAFCAACHGPSGQGMRFPGMVAFPAIGNTSFMEVASDDFLRQTITRGRPGTRMPAWGELEGGLRSAEIEAIVAYLRQESGQPEPASDERGKRWARDPENHGSSLYATHCASCHGSDGKGLEGPALNNRVLLDIATDGYLFETIRRGRPGTSMPAFAEPSPTHATLEPEEIEAIVRSLRDWEPAS